MAIWHPRWRPATVLLAVVAIAMALQPSGLALALDIKVDIDSRRLSSSDTTGIIRTQSGYTSWDLTNVLADGSTTTVDGVTFEIFGLAAANQSRTRGASGGGGGALNDALTDLVFNEGAVGRFVGLRISSLPVGIYAMQSWHYDSNSAVLAVENFTQVEVRTQSVAGSTVTYADMVPFSTNSIPFLLHVTSPGEVKEVIFREDDAATAADPLLQYRARLNAFTLLSPVELTLQIDTTTGATRIVNNQASSFDLKYYEVRSVGGSLNPATWISLDDTDGGGDIVGGSWDESPNVGTKLLNEVRLQQTNTLAPGQSENLGAAFSVGGARDVLFFYGGPNDATLRMGLVQYVTGAGTIAGDYNNNGVVDAADYVLWRNDGPLQNEGRSTGITDLADYHFWRLRYGATSGGAGTTLSGGTGVPEPAGYVVSLIGLIIALGRRRTYSFGSAR